MAENSETFRRGLDAFRAQDHSTAVSALEQATMEDHEDFQAFLYLGVAYAQVGRYNAAIGAFKRAEELRPGDARVHYNLGQAYEAAGVPREAIYEYVQALRINPYYAHARIAYSSLKSRLADERGRNMQLQA